MLYVRSERRSELELPVYGRRSSRSESGKWVVYFACLNGAVSPQRHVPAFGRERSYV